MKMKAITIAFTIVMAILIGVNLRQIQEEAYHVVDMTSLNKNYKQVVAGLEAGESELQLEKVWHCQIYLKTDTNYQSEVIEAIQKSKILMDYETGDRLLGKIVFSGQGDALDSLRLIIRNRMMQAYIGTLLIGYLLVWLIYYFYVRPFRKLQQFAGNVAKGNLDAPLFISQNNYFGAFTESFDLMREELKKARENEYRANISKKELVAELSHDMKTPIATIKATCEVMKLKAVSMKDESEKTDILEKTGIIEQKADMIDQLIGNMFHATLEELENLKVEAVEEASTSILDMFDELHYYEDIQVVNEVPECLVYMDQLRLKQVIDNIVNNSYKYAGTRIEVSFQNQEKGIVVEIRDFGEGMQEEELPFVTEKFFRGANGKGKSGSGLGLFLAKYFMDHMQGGFECYNDQGFVVRLFLRKV